MLFKISTRRLGRVFPRSNVITARVEQAAPLASRCLATSSTASVTEARSPFANGNHGFRVVTLPLRTVRAFADKPASRPKAHTGRSTRKTPAKAAAAKKTKKAAKPKAKAKPKKRATKKSLTPEEKQKARVRELKVLALKTPKQLPQTAYTMLSASIAGDLVRSEGISAASKKVAERYKNLSPSEREHYNHEAQENKAKNETAYKQWVRDIPAVDVYRANLARRHLTRLGVKGYTRRIVDDRQIKRPLNPQTLFVKDRHSSGEMAGIKPSDALKLITTEWKTLPQPEKQKYVDAASQDLNRYKSEYQQLFGRPYSPKPKAAAAA